MINPIKKLTVFFIFFILVFITFNQLVSYNIVAGENIETDDLEEPKIGLIGELFKTFGKWATFFAPIFRLSVDEVVSTPPYVEIGYNETKIIEVGLWDVEKNTGFRVWDIENPFFIERFIKFEILEYPKGTENNSWLILPDPYGINVEVGAKLKTNLSITLTKPPISGKPIQSGILKVRVLDTWAFGSLYFPPKGSNTSKILWFISAVFLMKFAKLSGTVQEERLDVDILVKIKPYHAVRFDTNAVINVTPDQTISIPISVQNLGNYDDTFGFDIISENKDLKLALPFYITLSPGEIKETYLGVSTPLSFFDYGTLHEVVIETYSIYNNNTVIAERQVLIQTKGIYMSEINGIGFVLPILIFFFVIFYFIYRKRLYVSRYISKPNKPWDIPEEKKYLNKLLKEDKTKYNEALKMMKDEYNSSLLWYKDYCKILKEIKKEKQEEKTITKDNSIKKKKIPFIKKLTKKEKQEEKTITKDIIIKKEEKAEDLRKRRLISKIKKREEKQKRKFMGKL